MASGACGVCGGAVHGSGRDVRIETRRVSDSSGRKVKTVGSLCAGCALSLARVLERPTVQARIFAALAWELNNQQDTQPTLDESVEPTPIRRARDQDPDEAREQALARWRQYRATSYGA